MSPKKIKTQGAADKRLQNKIARLQGMKHLPEQMVALVAEVARLQDDYLPKVTVVKEKEQLAPEILEKLASSEKHSAGLAILPGKEFPVDMASVKEFAAELLKRIPAATPELAALAEELQKTIEDDPARLEAACKEVLDIELYTDESCLASWAKAHPDSPHFFRFVVTSALMPSLVTLGQVLGKEHDGEKVWQHGHCPVCGNPPLMGMLQDKEGKRVHTCSFCAFEFRAPRMGCPFCLAPEDEGSEYYVSEDEPGYLLHVCKVCKNYFKLADLRGGESGWMPLLDDLASLTLDLYAQQMGYKRPTLSGWGF